METAACHDVPAPPSLPATELLPAECWLRVLGFLFPASSEALVAAMPLPEARATCKTFRDAVDDLEIRRLREEVAASPGWYFGSSKWRRLLSAILRKTSASKGEFTALFLSRTIGLSHRGREKPVGHWIFGKELLWVVRLLATRGCLDFLLRCAQGSTDAERLEDLLKQLSDARLPSLTARGEFAKKALRFVVASDAKWGATAFGDPAAGLMTTFSFSRADLEEVATIEFLTEGEAFEARLSSALRCLLLASDPRPFEGLWRRFGDRVANDEIARIVGAALSKLPFDVMHANRQSRFVASLDVVVRAVGAERLNRPDVWTPFVEKSLRAGSVVFLRWFSELYRPLGHAPVAFGGYDSCRWALRDCKSSLWPGIDEAWLLEPALASILRSCEFGRKDGATLFAVAATAGNPEWASRVYVSLWHELRVKRKTRRFGVDFFERPVMGDEVRLEPERCLALLIGEPALGLRRAVANLFACYAIVRAEDRPKLFQGSAARKLVESLRKGAVKSDHWLAVASESRTREELEAALGKWEALFQDEHPPEKPAYKRRRRLIRGLTTLAATFFYSLHPEHVELFAALRDVVEKSGREGALLGGLLSEDDPESLGASDLLEEVEYGLFASLVCPPSDPHPDNVARLRGPAFLRGARRRIKHPDTDYEDGSGDENWADVLSRTASFDLLDRVVERLDPGAVARSMRKKTLEPHSLVRWIAWGAPASLLKKTVRIACAEAARSIEATPGAEEAPGSLALRRRDAVLEALMDAFFRPFVRELRRDMIPEHASLKLRWFEKMLLASPRRLGRMLRLPEPFDADDWGPEGRSGLWRSVLGEKGAYSVGYVAWARTCVVHLRKSVGNFAGAHRLLIDPPFCMANSIGIDPKDSPRAFAHPRCYRWLRGEHLESTRKVAASLPEPHASRFLKSIDLYYPIPAGRPLKRARDEGTVGSADEERSPARRQRTA